jgi:hypothetical protein
MACLRLLGRGGGGAARLRLVEKWECGEPAAAGARAWSGAGAMPCCFGRPPPPPTTSCRLRPTTPHRLSPRSDWLDACESANA